MTATRTPLTDPRPGDVVKIPGGETLRIYGRLSTSVMFEVFTRHGRFHHHGQMEIETWRRECQLPGVEVLS